MSPRIRGPKALQIDASSIVFLIPQESASIAGETHYITVGLR